jgi:CRP-like cAMP-binding protein
MNPNAASAMPFVDLAGLARTRKLGPPDWAPVLADVPLFAGLSQRHRQRVAAIGRIRRVPRHSVVVREGDPGSAFFVIIDGAMLVHRDHVRRARLGPGAFFGELALLDDGPRTASVSADEESLLLELPRAKFLKLVRDEPTIASSLLKELASRLRGASGAD